MISMQMNDVIPPLPANDTLSSSNLAVRHVEIEPDHQDVLLSDASLSVDVDDTESLKNKRPVKPGDDFNDIFSITVRNGIKGIGLYSVIATACLMAAVSIVLLLQHEPTTSFNKKNQDNSKYSNMTAKPPWADILEAQIHVLQNLVHASLLGGAGFVAAYRGDMVWLFFARNCAFYFGLAATSYLVVDFMSLLKYGGSFDLILRLIICFFFTLSTGVALFTLEHTRQVVRRIQIAHFNGRTTDGTFPMPPHVPDTVGQYSKAKFMHFISSLVQAVSVFYTISTTMEYLSSEYCQPTEVADMLNSVRIAPFEMAYGLGAHLSFLLSLVFLASTFPKCKSSVGGAIIASGWRLLLALSYILNIVCVQSFDKNDRRQITALLYSVVDAILMLSILVTAGLLLREIQSKFPSYTLVDVTETNTKEYSGNIESFADNGCFECASLLQIAALPTMSDRQRQGAYALWLSSVCLFCTMTLECILLLGQLGTFSAEIAYVWGMHVCAMFFFVSHMSISCCDVYRRARMLLFVACPSGSMIALWQLWRLSSSLSSDCYTVGNAILLVLRALLGLIQTFGLIRLDSIPSTLDMIGAREAVQFEDQLVPFVRKLLYLVYVPCLAVYVTVVASFSSFALPLISLPAPSESCHASNGFMLAQHWPGLSLAFHFGGLLVIFASDGLSPNRSSYPPSLVIATLFAFHIGVLTLASNAWEYGHLLFVEGATHRHWDAYAAQISLALWTLSILWLYQNLRKISKILT